MEILVHLNVEIPDDQVERIMALADLGDVALAHLGQDAIVALAAEQISDMGAVWEDTVALAEINTLPADYPEDDTDDMWCPRCGKPTHPYGECGEKR